MKRFCLLLRLYLSSLLFSGLLFSSCTKEQIEKEQADTVSVEHVRNTGMENETGLVSNSPIINQVKSMKVGKDSVFVIFPETIPVENRHAVLSIVINKYFSGISIRSVGMWHNNTLIFLMSGLGLDMKLRRLVSALVGANNGPWSVLAPTSSDAGVQRATEYIVFTKRI